jgi:hypothetical protein
MEEEQKQRYRASFKEWSTTLYGVPAHSAIQQATNARDLQGRPEKAFLLVFQDVRRVVLGEEEARRQAREGSAVAVQLETFSQEQMERIRENYESAYELSGFAELIERMRERLEDELARPELVAE